MELYTPDFSNRYEISHAISVQMSEYYNDVGKLTLVLPVDDYNIAAIKEDGVLYDTVRKSTHIIKNVKIDVPRNRITANGYTTNWILNSRVIAEKAHIENVERGIYELVVANTGDDKLYFPASVCGGYINFEQGKFVVTHEFFELAVADMNMPYEKYPGWTDAVPGVMRIIDVVGKNHNDIVPGAVGNFTNLIGCNTCGEDSAEIQIYSDECGMTQSEIKKNYPDLKLQFYAPLKIPKEYSITPVPNVDPNVVDLLPTIIGSGQKSLKNPYEIIPRTNVDITGSQSRKINRFMTGEMQYYDEATDIDLYGGCLLDEIMPVLQSAELGNRMRWDYRIGKHVFEIYKGRNLTSGIRAVVFSDEQGTARDLVINEDGSIFKNVAYVRSEFDGQEIIVVVGSATGADRYEQWFDIRLPKEEGETLEQFKYRMEVHGAMELGKLIRRKSFSVVVDPQELGKMYNVGDVVSCVSKRFGVRFNARISGTKYKKDAASEVTEVILGEPKLTAIGEVRLNGKY